MIHNISTFQDFIDLKNYTKDRAIPPIKKIENGGYLLQWDDHESFFVEMNKFQPTVKNTVYDWVKNLDVIKKVETMDDQALFYGKNDVQGVVGCEIVDGKIELYTENEKGTNTVIIPNKYYILSSRQFDRNWQKLEGNLHYRYIKYYDKAQEWHIDKRKYNAGDIWFISDEKEAAAVLNGFTYFKGLKAKDVSLLSFDFETSGLTHDENSEIRIISNTYRKRDRTVRRVFSLDEFPDQKTMLQEWMKWVQEVDPAIITGFNIYGFDFQYLQFVCNMIGLNITLGRNYTPLRWNKHPSKFRKDGSQDYDYHRCYIFGREIVDMMFVAYHYDIGRKYESYRLKEIIKQEGLAREGRQYYDGEKIATDWHDPEKRKLIKIYAQDDADEVVSLWDLMIPSFFYLNQNVPKSCQSVNYSATGSIVNSFLIRAYLQQGHSLPKADEVERFKGAISDGFPGLYSNVFKVDVASLYPSIMLEYKIFNKEKDPQGLFLKMVEFFTKSRLENKKQWENTGDRYFLDISESGKVFINSAFGLLGAVGLLFNSPKDAALVTEKGRRILRKAILWATGKDYVEANPEEDFHEKLEDLIEPTI